MAKAEIKEPAAGKTALILIDMVNHLDFEGASDMEAAAKKAAERILLLRDEADRLGVPTVYVNDNFGQWHSERSKLVAHATGEGRPGREMVRRIAPRDNDFFVIKPQFSGFYATNLPVLLPKLGASRLVLTGIAADICVLFTAADAHMREYELWVPRDAVAGESERRTKWALEIMLNSMNAETRGTDEFSLKEWVGMA
ncbi:cysteine hydrolase [Mesorhizobium sp. RP14(2022)]|uniref:Cysteine hydrolase n=1 Tax=Mesorhizobium liriopis TaxID=2953882 RepID=A0ABT1C2N9_9HYPH|nr:cysteine hydrolase [Mesorhizobium liriopis]